ncbi:hypothetical protein QOT17_007141 [Balamuthia mandrillaris]
MMNGMRVLCYTVPASPAARPILAKHTSFTTTVAWQLWVRPSIGGGHPSRVLCQGTTPSSLTATSSVSHAESPCVNNLPSKPEDSATRYRVYLVALLGILPLSLLSKYYSDRLEDNKNEVSFCSKMIQEQFDRGVTVDKEMFEPLIERPYMDDLKGELRSRDIFQLVVGPSGSGKTWSYLLAAEQRRNTIYLSLRGGRDADFVKLVAQSLGIIDTANLDASTLVAAFNDAVQAKAPKTHTKDAPQPLVIIHDPQSCFKETAQPTLGMERFFAVLADLSKAGKLGVVFLSSSRDAVRLLKERVDSFLLPSLFFGSYFFALYSTNFTLMAVSGYRYRLSVKNMEYIPIETVRDHLVTYEHFSEEAADEMVEKLGSHLGHINRVRQKIVAKKRNHAGAWSKADVEEAINEVIYNLEQHLRPLFEQERDPTLRLVAYLVCKALQGQERKTITKSQVLYLLHQSLTEDIKTLPLNESEEVPMDTIATNELFVVIETLLEKRVLRDVDGKRLALHNQGLATAFSNLLKESHIWVGILQARKKLQDRAKPQPPQRP